MHRVGDVSGCEHVGVRAREVLVDEDAVVCLQARGRGQRDVRGDPDADDHQVRLDGATVLEAYDGPPARRLDRGDLYAGAQVHAVLDVQVGEHPGDLRPEHAQQRQVE